MSLNPTHSQYSEDWRRDNKYQNTFLMRSRASMVRYGGRLSLHFRILSMVFFLFSAVNGGWWRITRVRARSHWDRRDFGWKSIRCTFFLCTYWSSHHIIHEGSQTPPVHSSVVTWPGQDLWGPDGAADITISCYFNIKKQQSAVGVCHAV